MKNLNKQNYPFVNEFEMNEQIMNEIALGIWNQRKTNNKIPLFLYLVVAIAPLIYGVLSGKTEYTLLSAILIFIGFFVLLAYLVISALRNKKKWLVKIHQTLEKQGNEIPFCVCIGEEIAYRFNGTTKSISYHDVDQLLYMDMFLVLILKNGIVLPLWKFGFQKGNWEELIPYIKQMIH